LANDWKILDESRFREGFLAGAFCCFLVLAVELREFSFPSPGSTSLLLLGRPVAGVDDGDSDIDSVLDFAACSDAAGGGWTA
jgi:hypothetical protein